MNSNEKVVKQTGAFFLVVCAGLIMWGIWGQSFDWFTGPRIVILLALGAMFAQFLNTENNHFADLMVRGCGLMAFLLGGYLLTPYFWPGRIHNLTLFVVFTITALLAWLYLSVNTLAAQRVSPCYRMLCNMPLFLVACTIMSARLDAGHFYAPALLSSVYILEGAALVREGIKKSSRLCFNGGIGIFCIMVVAAAVTFFFEEPQPFQWGLMVLLVVLLNLFFNKIKGGDNK